MARFASHFLGFMRNLKVRNLIENFKFFSGYMPTKPMS
jgi:hypothetical protein